jgi:sterol 3beta-glucosyltransferase
VLAERSHVRDISQGDAWSLETNLEFFDAGGDPKSLMEYMVKSEQFSVRQPLIYTLDPGLLPGIHSVINGDVGRKQKMTSEMLGGFYRSTYSPDPISGRPFAADAVISNPPAFAHFHVAEALGIPLHMSFSRSLLDHSLA